MAVRKNGLKDSCEQCGSIKKLGHHHLISFKQMLRKHSIEEEARKEYLSLTNTLTFCNRCHFAWEKGMILCSKCKKKYHPTMFIFCYNCNPEKNIIELKKKLRELQYEINGLDCFERMEIDCYACGKEGWDSDWEEDKINQDTYFNYLLYCPKCKLLPNKKELGDIRSKEEDKKIRINKRKEKKLKQQQEELLNTLPLEQQQIIRKKMEYWSFGL